jgi:cytochrome b561
MAQRLQFTMFSRILHWTMAVMILAMLLIGVGMVASLSDYHRLVSIHKPPIRLVNRLLNPAPSLPDGMPGWQRFVAHASHVVLYALMFALPLVGWGMLSAARYPIVLYGPLQMPPILPHDASLYAMLRTVHTALAFLLFATFIAHFSAALMHALIYRDGVFASMASWKARAGQRATEAKGA